MRISAAKLTADAEATGFRPDMLEKVAQLLGLLNSLRSHPSLKAKWVLKGGTALNLFIFNVPRLSVDIDLNYVGAKDRDQMLGERPKVEEAVQAVFAREGFTVRRMPREEHAGGKWSLRYESASGGGGNLEVDINFMFRVPLWPVVTRDSHPVGSWKATEIPVLDIHELAAGKLTALLARGQPRDLFDGSRILEMNGLDFNRLRIGFVVYGAMNRKDWRTASADDLDVEFLGLARQLDPVLRLGVGEPRESLAEFGNRIVSVCRDRLSVVLPFTETERTFLDLVLDQGVIDPTLLTADTDLQQRIRSQPLLQWKAFHARRHKGAS